MLGCFFIASIAACSWCCFVKMQLLGRFELLPRIAAAIGLGQFFSAWIAFCWYLLLGMSPEALLCATATISLSAILILSRSIISLRISVGRIKKFFADRQGPTDAASTLWLCFFLALILPMFLFGITLHPDGAVSIRFNFIDTAQHLSYAQAFLASCFFPPLDLNMHSVPLKYHFLADFFAAFLSIDGLPLEKVMHWLNCGAAFCLVAVTWGALRSMLGGHPNRAALAGILFFFTTMACVNGLHYYLLHPAYYTQAVLGGPDAAWHEKLYRILVYPFFNFEAILDNLFVPQRAYLFSWPVIAICMAGMLRLGRVWSDARPVKEIALLVGLMPFAHTPSFFVLLLYLCVTMLLRGRQCLRAATVPLLLAVLAALPQLAYFLFYGPPVPAQNSGWDVLSTLPLDDFSFLPAALRIVAFWFFVNGEFFCIGMLSLVSLKLLSGKEEVLREFLVSAQPFIFCSLALFCVINVYRFSHNWGDSNKIVLFLNFWIALCGGYALERIMARYGRSRVPVWCALFAVVLAPWLWDNVKRLVDPPDTLFTAEDVVAAAWIKEHTLPGDVFLVSPNHRDHFLPPLTGRSVIAGIYSDVNPYSDPAMFKNISRLYEDADFTVLSDYRVRYVFVGVREREGYRLHPVFSLPAGVVASFGSEKSGAKIYDAHLLLHLRPN